MKDKELRLLKEEINSMKELIKTQTDDLIMLNKRLNELEETVKGVDNMSSFAKRLVKLEKNMYNVVDVVINKVVSNYDRHEQKMNIIEEELQSIKLDFDVSQILNCTVDEEGLIQEEAQALDVSENREISVEERSLIASKGPNWKNENLDSWLEKKLKMKYKDRTWRIKDYGKKKALKLVEFDKIEHKDFIFDKKLDWVGEGIWLWQKLITFTLVDVRSKLLECAEKQQGFGKRVDIYNNFIEIEGEKWVWVDKIREVVKQKVAMFIEPGHEDMYYTKP